MSNNYDQFLDWVIYQIYPKSFLDTNGDGIGDLRGVIKKLDYIRSIGANAIWLCPIFQSPQKDNGYDISNYYALQPEYGTMQDFENLVQEAHTRGIKIIMDLVANHTSDQHAWFQSAKTSKESEYHDYYYFFNEPPNDWQSAFGGSAWQYNPQTNEYYLHSFAVEQPDVNWENPKVREEYKKIVDFWISKGVDGFRCDVLDSISKDFQTGKNSNGPRLHEYIKELFGREEVAHIFTVGECWGGDMANLCAPKRKELKTAFRFDHLGVGQNHRFSKKPYTMYEITRILSNYQAYAKAHGVLYPLLTDNHDQPWFLSRYGNDKNLRFECATCFAAMVYCLKGVPFIYQGQEIGSVNSNFETVEDFNDIETVNYHRTHANEQDIMQKINFGNRDNSRRPLAWHGDKNEGYGWTSAKKPWISFATRSGEISVQSEEEKEKSVLKFYRKLFAFRAQSEVLRRGDFQELKNDENAFVYMRKRAQESLLIVCNFEKQTTLQGLPEGEKILGNYESAAEKVNKIYAPFETAIYKIREGSK